MTKKKDKKNYSEYYMDLDRNYPYKYQTPSVLDNASQQIKMSIPTGLEFGTPYSLQDREIKCRKDYPVYTGVVRYFPDALMRHLLDGDKIDDDGVLHLAKVAWRALAALQEKIENIDPNGCLNDGV